MLNTDSEDQLYAFIEYSVLSQIKKALDDDVIIELRIEGHTDKRMPEPIGDKKWYQFFIMVLNLYGLCLQGNVISFLNIILSLRKIHMC